MEIKTVVIPANEVRYFSFGRGKRNMVILPGLSLKSVMLSAEAVASAYAAFTDEFTVYVFDRPERLDENTTVATMARDTALAMQALGIRDACVFGASQGGMMTQVLALEYPALVQKAVLGSTASRTNPTFDKNLAQWLTYAKAGEVQQLNHAFFVTVYSPEFLAAVGDAVSDLERDGTPEEMARFVKTASACIGFDVYDRLPEIKCELLVFGAKNDRVLTGAASREIAEKAGCEIYMFDGEHAVYDEAPDYKDKLFAFFAEK